jgi:predicted nucleic acid-binding protein
VKRFVLDTSVALAWFLDHPMDPYAECIRQHLRGEWTAKAPLLWQTEVANILATAERRKILTPDEVAGASAALQQLSPTRLCFDASAPTLDELTRVAREYGLTAYGAVYLLLAIKEALPVATLDKALRAAMGRAGVALLQ